MLIVWLYFNQLISKIYFHEFSARSPLPGQKHLYLVVPYVRILLVDGQDFVVNKLERAWCENISANFVKLFCKVVLIKLLISNQQSTSKAYQRVAKNGQNDPGPC